MKIVPESSYSLGVMHTLETETLTLPEKVSKKKNRVKLVERKGTKSNLLIFFVCELQLVRTVLIFYRSPTANKMRAECSDHLNDFI